MTKRKEAIIWWQELSDEQKNIHFNEEYYKPSFKCETLSPRQVEELYNLVQLRKEDKAIVEIIGNSNITINDKMRIHCSSHSYQKYDYPFIGVKHQKGEIEHFYSEIHEIQQYRFQTREEVIMANAIFELIEDNFNPNEFVQQLKYTFRMLNVNSAWAE